MPMSASRSASRQPIIAITSAALSRCLRRCAGPVPGRSSFPQRAVYGSPERLPIDEATPKLPLNPYGETKLAVERALHWYAGAYGLRFAALRYFNAAGADPEGEIGED